MNEVTTTHYRPPLNESSALTVELAKMLALVAPITMSSEQQEIWLRAAADSLQGIHASEVQEVSLEVRRSVTRPSQIVPEIAKLVADHRSQRARASARIAEDKAIAALPPPPKHIMDRDRSQFTASDWAELNEHLEKMGSPVRYSSDGTKIAA